MPSQHFRGVKREQKRRKEGKEKEDEVEEEERDKEEEKKANICAPSLAHCLDPP